MFYQLFFFTVVSATSFEMVDINKILFDSDSNEEQFYILDTDLNNNTNSNNNIVNNVADDIILTKEDLQRMEEERYWQKKFIQILRLMKMTGLRDLHRSLYNAYRY